MEKVLRASLLCLGLTLFTAFAYANNNRVTGEVLYNYAYPLADVNTYLLDASGAIVATTITSSQGIYTFKNVDPGDYSIIFTTSIPAGGVDLTDAYLIMQYLMGQVTLTPFQLELADVNASGDVTWDDYNEMIESYLNQGNPFSGGDWVFESFSFTWPTGSREGFVTGGGSVGDVNGTFMPPKYGNCFLNNDLMESITASWGESANLVLEARSNLQVAGVHMVFDVPAGITVSKINSDLEGLHIFQEGSDLRITWINVSALEIREGDPILKLEVQANENTVIGDELHLSLKNESHFIGTGGEMLPFVNLSLPGIKFSEATTIAINENIYPNPFTLYTNLEYTLPSDGNIKVVVTNNAGQIVQVVSDEYQAAGPHQVKLDATTWPEGMYHYGIIFSGTKEIFKSGSMIKSK